MVSCLTRTNRLRPIKWPAGNKLIERVTLSFHLVWNYRCSLHSGKRETLPSLFHRDLTYCWVRQSVLYKRATTSHRSWGKSIGWQFQIAQSTSGDQIYLKLRLIVDTGHVVQRLCNVGQPELQLFRLFLAVLQRQFLLHLTLASHLPKIFEKSTTLVGKHRKDSRAHTR